MNIHEKLGSSKYLEFLHSCIQHQGNNERIRKVFIKDNIKLVFLGTSITLGYSSSGFVKDCYPKVLTELLQTAYPDKSFKFTNLGIAGVNSSYGLLQSEKYLNKEEPDIIIVEYAVNEGKDFSYIRTFESLIRKLLKLESKPAVLILSVLGHDYYSCGDYMLEIGIHYDLPVVGVQNSIPDYIAKGYISWEDYSDDEVHANTAGHQLLADCLHHAVNLLMSSELNPTYQVPDSCCYDAPYEGLKLFDFSQSLNLKGSYQVQADEAYGLILENMPSSPDPFLTFQCRCSSMIAAFEQSNDNRYGMVLVIVDGKEVSLLKGYSIFGWYNPVSQILFSNEEDTMHTIEFHMAEAGKTFRILNLGWC